MLQTCKNCGKEKEVALSGKSEGLCRVCYKKLIWKPRFVKCDRCERMKPMHAKGLCVGCYNSVFQLDKVRLHNARRYHGIDPDLYIEVIKECSVCGFDKIVEMHHLDHNKTNNTRTNLAGLCPNHHKMIHMKAHQRWVFDDLKTKGFNVPEKGYKTDGFYKKKL